MDQLKNILYLLNFSSLFKQGSKPSWTDKNSGFLFLVFVVVVINWIAALSSDRVEVGSENSAVRDAVTWKWLTAGLVENEWRINGK